MATSPYRFRALIVALALLGWTGTASADVTGRWHTPDGIRSLVQTGDDVTMTGGFTYEGTFVGSSIELVANVAWEESYSLALAPDGITLTGTHNHYTAYCGGPCGFVREPVTFLRCECYDGNGTNGDGCDLQCQSEEGCRSCSGDPATCTVAPDGTPCENRSSCIAGGVCEAGFCEGGSVDATCTDFTGGWLRTEYSFTWESVSTAVWEAVQTDGEVEFFKRPSTVVDHSAVIDAGARSIQIDGPGTGVPYCSGSYYPEPGQISETGRSFSTWGRYVDAMGALGCLSFEHFGELGLRCADFGLEASDGCRVDSCQRCGGDPEICEPVPDGTPCVSDDPYAYVSTCNTGECLASISTRTSSGNCSSVPRDSCRVPIRAEDTKLMLKDREDGDRLRWSWKDGARIAAYDLGRTDLYSQVLLCIYDGSDSLVFEGTVNEELDPNFHTGRGSELGWTSESDGSVRYNERSGRAYGITQIRIETGPAGDNSIRIKGAGPSLAVPRAELLLPMRLQLSIAGGACFEGRFGAEGVGRNADGLFRAKGTP